MDLIFASRNKGKVKEFKQILKLDKINLLCLDQFSKIVEVEETGTTFAENAELKSLAVAKATGLPTLADDSGLEVDALNGEPGVYSARYGFPDIKTDEERVEFLLKKMLNVPLHLRMARFHCALFFHNPSDGFSNLQEASCEGYILKNPIGYNGFGYDPIFFSIDLQQTFAEAFDKEKNRVSHRALATLKMAKFLNGYF